MTSHSDFTKALPVAFGADLHPAVAAMLALDKWTDHPAVAPLSRMIADLNAMTAQIHELADGKADLRSLASETGSLLRHIEPTGYVNQWRTRIRPNGGAIVSFWQALDDIRDAWINARLKAEGLHPHVRSHDVRYHDLHNELSLDAQTVEDAFADMMRERDDG